MKRKKRSEDRAKDPKQKGSGSRGLLLHLRRLEWRLREKRQGEGRNQGKERKLALK